MNTTFTALADERALIERATVESAAFAAIYEHYFPRIYSYVRYRVQDGALADDITAQIFERLLVHIGSYDSNGAPFAVWLFAIARNAVGDHLRSVRRRRWLPFDALREMASAEPRPEDIVVRGETREALLAAVAELSERERDLIALKFGAQLTNRRIASLTGLSESNVGVIVYRAVRRLRVALEGEE